MHKPESIGLFDRIGTPLFLLMLGCGAVAWFSYSLAEFLNSLYAPVVSFEKGACYLLGVGIGLLTLAFMIIKEFWLRKPLTKKESAILSGIAITGLVLTFLFPQIAGFAVSKHLQKHEYSVCEKASHRWLFVSTIVYVQAPVTCSENLDANL